MSSPTLRLIGSLALCLVLAAALPLAGAQQSATSPRPAATLEAAPAGLWTFVWRAVHSLWNKGGCSIDPYGRCLPGAPQQIDGGCRLDPYGRCMPGSTTPQLDGGCSADPYGICLHGS
jgi:hypothetical protein